MGAADAHHPMRQRPEHPLHHRRHRVRHGMLDYKLLHRCTLLAIWWIFVSPDRLFLGRTGGANSSGGRPWPTHFVAGQSYSDSSSSSVSSQNHGGGDAECDGHQQLRPAAFHSAVGHINYGVGLELGADIKIPGACEVNLPIDVSTRTRSAQNTT